MPVPTAFATAKAEAHAGAGGAAASAGASASATAGATSGADANASSSSNAESGAFNTAGLTFDAAKSGSLAQTNSFTGGAANLNNKEEGKHFNIF